MGKNKLKWLILFVLLLLPVYVFSRVKFQDQITSQTNISSRLIQADSVTALMVNKANGDNVFIVDTINASSTVSGNFYVTQNVGIGTTTPTTKLDVWGGVIRAKGAGASYVIDPDTSEDGLFDFYENGNIRARVAYDTSNSALVLQGAAAALGGANDHVVIKNTGNVGIGTIVPVSTLQIGAPVNATLNYTKLDTLNADTAGPPASTDCDASTEIGRSIVSTRYSATAEYRLWICTQTGAATFAWKYTTLT